MPALHINRHARDQQALAMTLAEQPLIPASLAAPLLSTAVALVSEAQALVAAYRERVAELERLTTTDCLTGLFNRRGFDAQLSQHVATARRFGLGGVLAMIDLDNFKEINDRHGHAAGDKALRMFGRLLREKLRDTDIVARFGGDEFAVLMTHCDAEAALLRLRLVAAEIAETDIEWQDARFSIRASIGTAPYGATDSPDDLLRRADAALYADKRFKTAA